MRIDLIQIFVELIELPRFDKEIFVMPIPCSPEIAPPNF